MTSVHDSQLPIFNPEEFSTELSAAFDVFWTQESELNWRVEEAGPEDKQRYLERELRFGTAVVVGAVALAAVHEGPVAVLFDIDETIAYKNYDEEEPRTIIRPAFPLVAAELKRLLGERLDIGILTGRGQSHLDEELSTPTTLSAVMDVVEPDLVMSAREDSVLAYAIDGDNYAKLAERISGTLLSGSEGYDITTIRKGYILQACVDMHPDTAFMIVDDHRWVNDLNPDNPRVAGIHVDPQMLFMV